MDETGTGPCWMAQTKGGIPVVGKATLCIMMTKYKQNTQVYFPCFL